MPVLVWLIIIGIISFYFLCSFLYRPIGKFFSGIMDDVKGAIKEEDEEVLKKVEEKHE